MSPCIVEREDSGVATRVKPRRWLARLVMTAAAWLVAFLVVMALLTLFSDELASLPLALRALVLSGVLVLLMVNVVMPPLSQAVGRWIGPTRDGSDGNEVEGSMVGRRS
jgi:antibiotic biosynthesis monooxygenase (ABM) superfamily enzyme